MNYNDYYTRQVGGALPYFVGARVQRGQGLGSLFGGLLRSVAPLIRRGAIALGKRALRTGMQIADDVVSSQNVKQARNDGRPTREKTWYVVSWLPPGHPRGNDNDL